jgi:RNA polymerase sigma-70 factor (ECF subfamily)
MNSGEESIPRDEWLEHAQALRRLAASLVSDEHEAQDLVQETWLRASRAQQSQGPWLRTVLRNLVRDRSRERARRASSERSAARDEELPSASEMAERLDVAQRVALEVARLAEPYRTVIHLRYFEGLSPEDIARRSRVPLETVRTRLRRGLAQLRERMDGAYGGRRAAWSVALAAIAWRGKPALTATIGATLATVGGLIMSTKVVLSATAVVIAALSLFVWQRSNPEPVLGGAPPAKERAIEGPVATPKVAALDDSVAKPTADVRAPATTPALPPDADDASIEVRGTVVITDENGVERKDESGVLGIATGTSEADAKRFDLAFEHGQWSTRIPRDRWLVFGALTANHREAVLPKPAPIKPDGTPIVVRGEWTKRGRLRVIDAKTKQDLSEVEVRCSERGWRANPEATHPGDDERIKPVIEHAASPFDLPERTRLTPYWVHAPNHAWARIDFQHKVGGMRTIELSPTPSSAIVAVEGDLPKNAIVRLYPTEPRPPGELGIQFSLPEPEQMQSWIAEVAVHASTTGPTRIDDLQPGKFLATVEVGEYEGKLRVGSAPIEVKAGETAHVTVPIDASLLAVPRTHLFGTIEVPESLDRANCSLKLARVGEGEKPFQKRLAEMSYSQGDRSTLRWDAGPMRTGDYVVTLTSLQHRQVIHAPGPGETKLALTLPPLSTVTVEVVDAVTGAKIDPERLQWTRGENDGISGHVLAHIAPNLKTHQLEFVAPRGDVELDCETPGYEEVSRKFTLTKDAELLRLELAPATAIHLALREDDAALNVGFTFLGAVKIQREGNPGSHARAGTSTDSEKTWYVDEPGRYEILFPNRPGFEPLEPRTIDVVTGKTTEVIVSMKRRP